MKLIAINTLGLTGAEVLCAELARHPEIAMIPGQNFIRFKSVCYRPHDYEGIPADDVFEMLSAHHFTRSGKCWSGLSKSMSEEAKHAYDRSRHQSLFAQALGKRRDFLSAVEAFSSSMRPEAAPVQWAGWFGNNIVINAQAYPGFDERAVVINFSNPVDYWLANIGQRFVWDNLKTLQFWIVNELYLRDYARGRSNYLSIDILEYLGDRDKVSAKIRGFLGLAEKDPIAPAPPDGFIRFNQELVRKISHDAETLLPIYRDHALYKLASRLPEWSDAFLLDSSVRDLLRKYAAFWNSTCHTNLDWVGPIEEELVERALDFTGYKSERNLSCWFYHECFKLDCDRYETPRGFLEHYLGNLEEEIAFPPLAYYARVVVCYIQTVAENVIRRPYSATPIRSTNLYRRLTDPAMAARFPGWAMTQKVVEMEQAIDRAEAAMSVYYKDS